MLRLGAPLVIFTLGATEVLDIARMPAGYDTVLGTGGSSLAGGQRQRIALARALVRRPAEAAAEVAPDLVIDAAPARVHEPILQASKRAHATTVRGVPLARVASAEVAVVVCQLIGVDKTAG